MLNKEPGADAIVSLWRCCSHSASKRASRFGPTSGKKRFSKRLRWSGRRWPRRTTFSNPRIPGAHYVEGSAWEFATVCPPDQRREHFESLDGRAAWFYEAVTNNIAMHGQETGKGQVYLAAYRDRRWRLARRRSELQADRSPKSSSRNFLVHYFVRRRHALSAPQRSENCGPFVPHGPA